MSADHILAVLSAPAVIILVPCGLNDTFDISPSWPFHKISLNLYFFIHIHEPCNIPMQAES